MDGQYWFVCRLLETGMSVACLFGYLFIENSQSHQVRYSSCSRQKHEIWYGFCLLFMLPPTLLSLILRRTHFVRLLLGLVFVHCRATRKRVCPILGRRKKGMIIISSDWICQCPFMSLEIRNFCPFSSMAVRFNGSQQAIEFPNSPSYSWPLIFTHLSAITVSLGWTLRNIGHSILFGCLFSKS